MHPILFRIGDFPVALYGVLIAAGLAAALWLALRLARRDGLPPEPFYDLAFTSIVGGFVGARILYIGLNWSEFRAQPMAVITSREGFVFLGGLIAAIAVDLGYVFWKKLPVWRVADAAAPGLILGHAFGRVGCFFSGCCYGKISEHSHFGVCFPKIVDAKGDMIFSYSYADQLRQGLIPPTATESLPVLPTQLFESATNFLICGVLVWLWGRRSFRGQIFVSYLFLYGVARFLLEYARGDAARGLWFGGILSTSQLVSLGLVAAGAILWPILRGRPENQITGGGDASMAPAMAPNEPASSEAAPGGKAAKGRAGASKSGKRRKAERAQ